MQLDKIDYFILAHDEPTFSSAAAKVPMTPQGFAKAIRNLENEVGRPLFTMGKDGSRAITKYGEAYYNYAKRVKSERILLSAEFKRIGTKERFDIRLAAALGIPGLFGIQCIEKFEQEHPCIHIADVEMPDALRESMVRDGLYDLALTTLPTSDEFAVQPIRTEPVLIWVKTDDPLSEKKFLNVEDIASRTLAMPGEGFKAFSEMKARFSHPGLVPQQIVKYSEIFWIYDFVSRGQGLGFTLPHLVELDVFNQDRTVIALPVHRITWSIGFAWLKTNELSDEERAFIDYIASMQKTKVVQNRCPLARLPKGEHARESPASENRRSNGRGEQRRPAAGGR